MLINNDRLSLGKLIMFLVTDGSVSVSDYGKFEISFVNHNSILVSQFMELFESIFGPSRFHLSRLFTGHLKATIFSKSAVNFLRTLLSSFRTKNVMRFLYVLC